MTVLTIWYYKSLHLGVYDYFAHIPKYRRSSLSSDFLYAKDDLGENTQFSAGVKGICALLASSWIHKLEGSKMQGTAKCSQKSVRTSSV